MTAQIILKDENGNFATIDNLSDWDLFREGANKFLI